MKKNTRKAFVVAAEFCSRALFVLAVGDLAAACKRRTSSPAARVAIDVATGVVVGLHALYRDDLVSSRLEQIEAEPDPAPVAAESPADWNGDEAPFVEEE